MAKNKVINTILTVQDKMSGGLVAAAKSAKKSGKNIDSSMIKSTQQVIAFKNKSVKALTDAAKNGFESLAGTVKKTAIAVTASASAAATGLAALTLKSALAADDLNTLAKQSGFSTADVQKWQYASDLIDVSIDDIVKSAGKMKKNMISTSKTTIAAWDQLGIKVKDSNGHLRNSTTVFYETLTALSKVQNETERDTLAMTLFGKSADSLAGIVDDGGAALQELAGKAEKAGVILSQDTLDGANALNDKVDTLKATVKGFSGKVGSELAGRASKALDVVGSHFSKAFNVKPMDWMNSKLDGLMSAIDGWISSGGLDAFADKLVTGVQTAAQKAGEWLTKLKDWIASGGLDALAAQLAGGVQQGAQIAAMMIDKAAAAMQWCQAHTDTLVSVLKVLAGVWGIGRVFSFVAGIISAGQTIGGFIKTLKRLVVLKGKDTAAWAANTACVIANKVALAAHAVVGGMRWLVNGIATLMTNTVEWSVNTACIIANKAALIAHKAVGGVVWLVQQAAALGVASAAWIHNTAMMVVNKAGMVASAVASGVATGATAALTAAQWALNAAFVATPIGWIVLGLAAVVAAGVALYKNWDTVKAKAGEVWNSIKTAFGGIRDSIVNAFSAAKEKVAGFFSWLNQKIESVPILGSIYKGGKNAVSWIADRLDGNAMGTPYWRGGYTRVNERGGEIMNLPSGTQIIPHDVSVKAAGGRSVTVNVTIQGNVIGNREYTEQVGEYVGRKVLAALGNT